MIEAIVMIGLICNSQGCWWVDTDLKFQTEEACQIKSEDYRHKTVMYFDLRCVKRPGPPASS